MGAGSELSAGGALVAKVVFLATGVWWGVGVQLMVYAGIASDPSALLPNFTWYASMLLGLLLSERFLKVRCCDGGGAEPRGCSVAIGCLSDERTRDASSWSWWRLPPLRGLWASGDLVLAAWCDYLGTVATAMGLTLAGSGIFGLIYSSVSCWAALFAYCLLGRRLVAMQVVGMLIVVAGLIVASLDNEIESEDGKRVAIGSALIGFGTVAYGLEYALCERLMAVSHGPPAHETVSAEDGEATPSKAKADRKPSSTDAIVEMMWHMGLWGILLSALYTAAYVAPRWDRLVGAPVREAGASPGYLAFLVVSHTVSNWLHNLSWFIICDREGSVSTGLIQGLKAVLLFAGSSVAFCHRQESQCMTRHKVTATAIVTLGTAVYYLAPNMSTAELAAQRERDGAGAASRGDAAYELVSKPGEAASPLQSEEGNWD